MGMMGLISQDDEISYLLTQIDPYKNNRMTYSEVVQLLSSHMVPNINSTTGQLEQIPILEKFSLAGQQSEQNQQHLMASQEDPAAGMPPNHSQQQLHSAVNILNNENIGDLENMHDEANGGMGDGPDGSNIPMGTNDFMMGREGAGVQMFGGGGAVGYGNEV